MCRHASTCHTLVESWPNVSYKPAADFLVVMRHDRMHTTRITSSLSSETLLATEIKWKRLAWVKKNICGRGRCTMFTVLCSRTVIQQHELMGSVSEDGYWDFWAAIPTQLRQDFKEDYKIQVAYFFLVADHLDLFQHGIDRASRKPVFNQLFDWLD